MTTEQILALSGRELDYAVALALGWVFDKYKESDRVALIGPNATWHGVYDSLEDAKRFLPGYSTDPAAAALVRAEVEAKGWEYRVFNLAHGTAKIRQYIAYLWGEGLKQQGAESGESEYIAFNRAFLLIHFAEKELNDE